VCCNSLIVNLPRCRRDVHRAAWHKWATAADDDLQSWFPMQLVHPVDEQWSLSMQTEVRLQDDISEFSENWSTNRLCTTTRTPVGSCQPATSTSISTKVPTNRILNRKSQDLVTGYQVRLEERVIDDIDGVLPRLRLLTHMSHPLGESPFYLTGFGAVRFNLDNKGEGPVSGFEQSRLSLSLGHHIGDHIQFEAGYLWRYELERGQDDKSDHAVHLYVLVNTKAKRVKKPAHRDRYR
jgi:hypothetical protein